MEIDYHGRLRQYHHGRLRYHLEREWCGSLSRNQNHPANHNSESTTWNQPSGKIRQPSSVASPTPTTPPSPVPAPPWGGQDRTLGGMFPALLAALSGRDSSTIFPRIPWPFWSGCMGGTGLHRLTEEQDRRFPNLKDLHIGNGNRNLWDQMFTWSLASACAKLEVLYQAERARGSIEAASRAAAKSMPSTVNSRQGARNGVRVGCTPARAAPHLTDDDQGRTPLHACVFKALRSQKPDTPARAGRPCRRRRAAHVPAALVSVLPGVKVCR